MKKPPQDLSKLLHKQGQLPSLTEKAEFLLYLDHHVKQLLSGPITEQLKVANFRQDVLIIETTTAAWAARINFQKKQILQRLQLEALPMLTTIKVKVNPGLHLLTKKPTQHSQSISPTAAAHIQALADNTTGTLGEKLKRLAKLANRSKPS